MKTDNKKNHCRRMRKAPSGLWDRLRQSAMQRLSDHVAHCPRCRRRLAMVNRVELSLMLIKTQPLNLGLLAKANTKALDVLKQSLRNTPKSVSLRNARPELTRLQKMQPVCEHILNAAACVFVLLMIKTGVSNSLLNVRDQGETIIENYYARNLDSRLFDEIFPDPPRG